MNIRSGGGLQNQSLIYQVMPPNCIKEEVNGYPGLIF